MSSKTDFSETIKEREKRHNYYEENKEKFKEKSKKYYEENKEKISQKKKAKNIKLLLKI